MPHYKPSSIPFLRGVAHNGKAEIAFSRITTPDQGSLFDHVDYVEVPSGADIGFHRHAETEEEVYIVMDGNGQMTLGDETFRVERGDIIINPPGGGHALVNDSGFPIKLVVIQVSYRAVEGKAEAPGYSRGGVQ